MYTAFMFNRLAFGESETLLLGRRKNFVPVKSNVYGINFSMELPTLPLVCELDTINIDFSGTNLVVLPKIS